jgi:hypothetical protein
MTRENLKQLLTSAAFVVAGILMGTALQSPNRALGEVRSGPPPTAFQSGGQMSVPILKEISATLHLMDGRLERLELVAKKLQTAKPGLDR